MFNLKFFYQQMNDKQIDDAINVIAQTKESRIFAARRLARWFEISITIKMFGKVLFQWTYPPVETDNINSEDSL